MGKLLNYLGESKILKRIADVLNVKDVKVNGVSVVDNNGDAIIPSTTQVQSDWAQTDNTQPDYIKNKPSAPSGQVQSDWDQTDTSEPDFIKNKPTIPDAQIQSDWNQTTTTAKDYIKNKPTIPAAQVQSDWEQDDSSEVDFIKNKPTLSDVATSGDYDDLTNKPDIPTITDTYDGTSQDGMSGIAVQSALDALPEPMVFRGSLGTGGTITALPVDGSASIGDTYKVITAGTYAGQSADIGDTFICETKTSSANTWVLIPSGDEPSGTVTSVTIKATSPIVSSSSSAITTSGTRTISHATSGATAGSYGDSSAQTPNYGATFKVPYVTVNDTGHVTSISEHTVKIPASDNTDTKVTSAANHYPPSTVSGEEKTASASGASAAWSIDVVKGLTVSTDGKGHITDLAVTSGKIPANPSKNSTITIQKNGTTVDSFTLNQSTDKSINITMSKSDVGLDNVPNVTTNNQTPTFTQASTRANIVSGEKLSVIFGKIMKFFADLKTVAFTGSYDDLTNKPTIPSAQVNSDWNASSGVAQILNKPTLATVATSGSYNDLSNKPTIPSAVAVKGNAESSYRTGNVNLTPANIGALSLSGGTVTGNVRIARTGTTSSVNSYLYLGNDTAAASGGARGIIDIFSSNTYRTRIYHDTSNMQLTDDRNLYLPNKDGTIAVTSDIKTYTGTGLISVNSSNEISTTAEVNQNAFSKVSVTAGTTTTDISAGAKQDTVTLVQGSRVTLTPDATNKTVTIAASDVRTRVQLKDNTDNTNRPLLMANGTTSTTGNIDGYPQRIGTIYGNPSTGGVYATLFDSNSLILHDGNNTTTLSTQGLSGSREIYFPNIDGGVVVGSTNYGSAQTGTSGQKWGALFKAFRDNYITGAGAGIRRSAIRVSLIDGYGNLIFQCSQYVNANTMMFTCTFTEFNNNVYSCITYTFRTTSSAAYLVRTSMVSAGGGYPEFYMDDLTNESANGATITIL